MKYTFLTLIELIDKAYLTANSTLTSHPFSSGFPFQNIVYPPPIFNFIVISTSSWVSKSAATSTEGHCISLVTTVVLL